MKKSVVIIVALCAVEVVSFYAWKKSAELKMVEEGLGFQNRKYPIVYAKQTINEGDLVKAEALETKLVPCVQIPDHVVMNVNDVIGRRPIYAIRKGDLLCEFDFRDWETSATRVRHAERN